MKSQHFRSLFILILIVIIAYHLSTYLLLALTPYSNSLSPIFQVLLNALVIPYFLVWPLLYLVLRTLPRIDRQPDLVLSHQERLKIHLWMNGLGIFLILLLGYLNKLITGSFPDINHQLGPDYFWPLVLVLLVINPILENLVYRKLILDRIPYQGPLLVALINGLLFAYPHFFNLGLVPGLRLIVIGAILAYVTVRTGKLIEAILLHAVMNFLVPVLVPLINQAYPEAIPIYFLVLILLSFLISIQYIYKKRKQG